MSRIDGGLSLSEAAARLQRSHAWIKKTEKKLNLPVWGSGQRGKRSSYDFEKIEVFRKVKVLVDIGLSLDEVKGIYDAEEEIRKFFNKNFIVDSSTVDAREYTLYLTGGVYPTNYDEAKFKDYKTRAVEAKKMYDEYSEVMKTVLKLLDERREELGEERKAIEGVTGKGK